MSDLNLKIIKDYVDKKVAGALTGKSAYEIAVEQGYEGTEEEWLSGMKDYEDLENKPQINNHTLSGNKSSDDLGLQSQIRVTTEALHYMNNLLELVNNVLSLDANKTFKWFNPMDSYYEYNSFPFNSFFVVDSQAILEHLSVGSSGVVPVNEFGVFLNVKNDIFTGYPEYDEGTEYGYYHDFYLTFSGELYHKSTTKYSGYVNYTEWQKINGGSQIVSGVVNQNGTITFTDSDGNTFTTSGSSVIGADGIGIADVHIDGGGDLIVETTDGYMENVGHVVGANGQNYVLTTRDKSDIADIVLSKLPTTQEVLYGNTSN